MGYTFKLHISCEYKRIHTLSTFDYDSIVSRVDEIMNSKIYKFIDQILEGKEITKLLGKIVGPDISIDPSPAVLRIYPACERKELDTCSKYRIRVQKYAIHGFSSTEVPPVFNAKYILDTTTDELVETDFPL